MPSPLDSEFLHALEQSPVFAPVPAVLRPNLLSLFQPQQQHAGQMIEVAPDSPPVVALITRGTVQLLRRDPPETLPTPVLTLGRGDLLGLHTMAVANPDQRPLTALCLTDVAYHSLALDHLRLVCMNHPEVAWNLSAYLARQSAAQAAQAGLPLGRLAAMPLDPELLKAVPLNLLVRIQCIPIERIGPALRLAMVKSAGQPGLDELTRYLPATTILPVRIDPDDFQAFIQTTYPQLVSGKMASDTGNGDSINTLLTEDLLRDSVFESPHEDPGSNLAVTDLTHSAEDPPIIRLANNILAMAIHKGASDIHLEPQEHDVLLRFRIDGVLIEEQHLPKRLQLSLTSRLKIIANMDIAERRLPLDGRISVRQHDRAVDFRVSTIPTRYGEKIVMRLLDKSNTLLGLDRLIQDTQTLADVRTMIAQPYGIIFVTGPTGSGKTTTLYSALNELNSPEVNISTVEDPVEYELPRINQVQVRKEVGLDFARVLRAFLRQDPDIILVGETRDKETAHTAIEAALTGHLVFTTLHTNSAAASVVRLTEMGIEPFLVASAAVGVIAQRLARRICRHCREDYVPEAETLRFLRWPEGRPATFYRGVGCAACHGSGYKGRVGIYEVMPVDDTLRHLISTGAEAAAIHAAAVAAGMKDLHAAALELLATGDTTVEQVLSTVSSSL